MANGLKAMLALLGIAVIVGGVAGLTLIDGASRQDKGEEADAGNVVSSNAKPETTIPPLDAAVPANLRTATFALG